MKNIIFTLLILTVIFVPEVNASIKFTGNSKSVIEEKPEASTGLDAVFVLFNTDGVAMSYTSKSGNEVKWYKFSSLGGGYAEVINEVASIGNTTTLEQVIPNMGYIIEDGTDRKYFWVVDYSDYYLELRAIMFNPETECDVMTINVEGAGQDVSYYTINGQHKTLDREIELRYYTQQWNDELIAYELVEVVKLIDGFKSSIATQAPLCNTTFYLTGDKFLKKWGLEEIVESELFQAQAVEVKGFATQSNKTDQSSDALGGSAPAEIVFDGYFTEAVAFKEWQIAKDAEFEETLYRFNEESITYTFTEAGNFYIRLYGANADGTCDSMSEIFTVNIGESRLECPNAFSPKSDIEDSRVWRVAYKSIVEFKCHIFNRYGMEVFSYSDPSQGWDGKYKGKYASPGVYFYVIEARGADGKEYKLKGDINIINLKEQ